MKVYIAGPMTGLPDLNYPAFAAAAEHLRASGHDVVSPAEVNAGREHEGWHACMRRDVAELTKCHAIYLLDGWPRSRGARIEMQLAKDLGLMWLKSDLSVVEMA